jgi:beta-glucanase (GH16 family)
MTQPRVHLETTPDARPLVGGEGQSLVFSDEFSGTSLDTSKWYAVELKRPPGNQKVEYWYKSSNVRITNGVLALDICKIPDKENAYGGSRVDSRFAFKFGTIEYRIHVPPTIGHLAAVWLQASNGIQPHARDGAEIDIAETFSQGDKFAVTIHWGHYEDNPQSDRCDVPAPGLHAEWYHTFTLNWSSAELIVSYDGKPVRTIVDPDRISQVHEFPIVSNEIIGFAEGNIHDAPLDWHSTMYVDYIRVWQ